MRSFILVVLCCLPLHTLWAADNLFSLEKQANSYQQQLHKNSDSKSINSTKQANLSDTAYFFYKNKDCKLAANIQKKLIKYQVAVSAFDWYRLSLYTACNYDKKLALNAIFLAWDNEQQVLQKHRYRVMLANYLFSIKQLKSSWNADLTSLYQQLIKSENDPQLAKKFQDKIEQLKLIKTKANQLIFSNIRSQVEDGKLKICTAVNLSGYWDTNKNREIKIQDYLRFEPKFEPLFERNYNELCLLGAKWSTDYRVDILKGLEIESKILAKTQSFNLKTESRPADFWFKRSRYILSKNSSSQIPVYAVNTAQIHVGLYRILPENLQNNEFLRLFRNSISNYDLKRVSEQLGNKVWSSNVLLNPKQKQHNSLDITTINQIPLPEEYLQQSGVYILIAGENEKQLNTDNGYEHLAAQWLVVSDIGLTSYKTDEGITVLAHSLETGKVLSDLNLSMYSKNNSLLAKEVTDLTGKVIFDRSASSGGNGLQPMQLLASHPDYGFLFYPLERAGFDLSDRGVSGRISLSAIEAYLYTERGIYRPGETVNLIALLRNNQAQAIEGFPLTLKISNPDGRVVREQVIQEKAAGGYFYPFQLPMAIRTGHWQFEVYGDVNTAALGKVSFLIEEIKPPRLQANIKTNDLPVSQHQNKQFILQADYLFGAPGADLIINSNISYHLTRSPFNSYPDFVFGIDDSGQSHKNSQWTAQLEQLNSSQQRITDAEGKAVIDLKLPSDPIINQPLAGSIRAEVLDIDGTMVAVQSKFSVRNLALYIGIGKSFHQRAPENTDFDLEIITLDEKAQTIRKQNLNWRLIREDSYFQWFNKQGSWAYEKIVQDHLEQEGVISSRKLDIEQLRFKLPQGQYRLEVSEQKTSVTSSYRFVVGEQVDSINDLPDVVKLTLDKADYKLADEVELTINSPYTGEADIVIADKKIHSILKLHLTEKQTTIKLPVSESWGVGTYALVSVYRGESKAQSNPLGTSAEEQPESLKLAKRAMGVIWINRDKTPYQFNVNIDSPVKIKPAQQINVPIIVENVNGSEVDLEQEVYLTLAAVDLGVLNLTDFKSPKPLEYFLAKRRLETQINDNYARLIDNLHGKPAQLRTGGDTMMQSSRASTPAKNIKIVSLFTGIVKLQKVAQGGFKAIVPLNIPDFNGQLKLMAVVWDKFKSGSAQKNLFVNDDVVIQTSLPRFLTKGDQGELSVLVHNLHAKSGEYRLLLKTDSLLQSATSEVRFSLNNGESVNKSFTVKALQTGNAKLSISLFGPENYQLEKHYNIGLRGIGLPTSEQLLQQLPGNSELLISQLDLSAYEPFNATKSLSLSSGLNLGVYSLLEKLDRYPHGCLEQLVSRVMPLLSVDILSHRWNYPIDPMLDSRINEAITLILDKQRYNGSFGLWNATDKEESWLSFYAMEFLLQAANKSYRIPDFFIQRGLKWVTQYINQASPDHPEQLANLAYAHYVLALAGQGKVEESRYLAKQYAQKMPTLLAYAQLVNTLQLMGENTLADKLEDNVSVLQFKRLLSWQDYGSQLRDMAGLASLFNSQSKTYQQAIRWISQVVNSQSAPQNSSQSSSLSSQNHRKYLSTQEQAWLIRLALTLGQDSPLKLSLDGKVIAAEQSEMTLKYEYSQLANSKQLSNHSSVPIWVNTTLYGEPKKVSASENGFKISKTLYDELGNPVDLLKIEQGQRLIMLIKGKATSGLFQRAIIVDLLAAGLEVENANLQASFDMAKLSWLPDLTPTRYIEALDDRFVAAIDIAKGKQQEFTIAYPVRAITPGVFHLPAIYIEDMYQPYFRANTEVEKLQVIKSK
jgi:alpha-2-macroglobulin